MTNECNEPADFCLANPKLMPPVSRISPQAELTSLLNLVSPSVAPTRRSGQQVAKHLQTGSNLIQPACVQFIGKYGLESIWTTAVTRVRNLIMPNLNLSRRRIGGLLMPVSAGLASSPTMCCERKRRRLTRQVRALG
jgi:hypothetical protein